MTDRPADRISRLERRVLLLAMCSVSGFVVLGTVLFLRSSAGPTVSDVFEGRSVLLADAAGVHRVNIGTTEGGWAGVTIADAAGTHRVNIGTAEGGWAGVTIADAAGVPRVNIGSNAGGLAGVIINDANAKQRAGLTVGLDGEPTLRIFDSSDHMRVAIGQRKDGTPGIELGNAEGQVTWRAPGLPVVQSDTVAAPTNQAIDDALQATREAIQKEVDAWKRTHEAEWQAFLENLEHQATPRGHEQAQPPSRLAQPPTPATPRYWTRLSSWSGAGAKQTESFEIVSEEWRISWTAKGNTNLGSGIEPGSFSVTACDVAGKAVALVANVVTANGSDTGYVHGKPGRFYLDVSSFGVDWTITVEDQR